VNKILKKFSNIFSGKKNYKKVIDNYEKDYLKKIQKKNNNKIINVSIVIRGVEKQIEQTKQQITDIYNEKVCA
jgi:predicted  nucleic acid-binding Zn-ribbon protein